MKLGEFEFFLHDQSDQFNSFRAKGCQTNDKTVTMAPLGLLNEDVKTAGSTKDIRVYYVYPDSSDSYSISQMLNAKTIEHPVTVE